HNREEAVTPDAHTQNFGTPRKLPRELDQLLLTAHDVVGCCHGHEDEPHRKQNLIEVARLIEAAIKRPLENTSESCANEKGSWEAPVEGDAVTVHHHHGHVTAGHCKCAMGQIDEVHQSQRDRQSASENEEKHAIGDAVEKNGQHWPSPVRRPD